MVHFLYILESDENGRFYVGSSSDPERRLFHHNHTEAGFTSRYRPWRLIYEQPFSDKRQAMKAERKVKRWKSREMIKKLIAGEVNV